MNCKRCHGSKEVTVKNAKTGKEVKVTCPVCSGSGQMKQFGLITK